MYEVYGLLGIKKVNTTAYHPQTDGLVERFDRTLISMLAKTVQKQGRDWELSKRANQESSKETETTA